MSLLTQRFVTEIAFSWDAQIRVFQADRLNVTGDEELTYFRYSDGAVVSQLSQLWLVYELRFRFLKRISPETALGNDFVDLRNALLDSSKTVTLYPIYNVDATVTEVVKPTPQSIAMLSVERWRVLPKHELTLISATSKQSYPDWLRNTYQK